MPAQATATPETTAEPPRALGSGEAQDREALARSAASLQAASVSRLEAPVRSLKGAGPKLSARAADIGLETIGDLLWHLPHGYRDRSNVLKIGELRIGEEATVAVEVRKARVRPTRRRNLRIVEADVADVSGATKAVWFNQAWLVERLRPGTKLSALGQARPLRVQGVGARGDRGRGCARARAPHRRPRPGSLGHGRPQRRPRAGVDLGLRRHGSRHDRGASAGGPLGARPGRRRRRAGRGPLPVERRATRKRRAAGSPSRSSSSTRSRWPQGARGARTSVPASRSTRRPS